VPPYTELYDSDTTASRGAFNDEVFGQKTVQLIEPSSSLSTQSRETSEDSDQPTIEKIKNKPLPSYIRECMIKMHIMIYYLWHLATCSPWVNTKQQLQRYDLIKLAFEGIRKEIASLKEVIQTHTQLPGEVQEAVAVQDCHMILAKLRTIFESLAEMSWASVNPDRTWCR